MSLQISHWLAKPGYKLVKLHVAEKVGSLRRKEVRVLQSVN